MKLKKMKIVKIITTKNKRFSLTTHDGFSGKWGSDEYTNWKNNYLLEMDNLLVKYLEDGYTEVPNGNGGDDDYLCFDNLKKQFIWCENGFAPFQKTDLERYENDTNITLEYLYSIRF